MKLLRTLLLAIAVLLLAGAIAIYALSERAVAERVAAKAETLAASSTPIDEAHRRIVTLGCTDCHGANLGGQKFIDDPKLGVIWAPNLTTVAARASDQQLAQAIRQGIGADGRSLLAMPAVQYRFLTDTEVADVIRAVRAMPRAGEPSPPARLGPLARLGLATDQFRTEPRMIAAEANLAPPDLGAATAIGRHLVATHCSDCHGRALAGNEPEPGIKAPDLTIAGAYDLPAFARLLRTGIKADGKKAVLMGDVAPVTFARFTDPEIKAIHDYLVARAQR
jgi:mono/diheme cytochrome c family protein